MVGASVLLLALVSCLAASDRDESRAAALLRNNREEDAAALLGSALEDESEPQRKARLYVLLGIARLNLRDSKAARAAFTSSFESDPGVELPQALASPRARE